MKKKLLFPSAALITMLLIITGCQKSVIQTDADAAKAAPGASLTSQCQLNEVNAEGFMNRFHYNGKGLADEWQIDFGDGIPNVWTMAYDNDNKLSNAWLHYEGNLIAIIDFTWTGNLLTDEHWNFLGFEFDYVNTYDHKGQRIKSEGSDGFSAETDWTSIGNVQKTDIFFNGELIQRGEYTYNQPNKNPYNAIHGIPYLFPFLNGVYGKWWETSEKITIDGQVVFELDPSKTVFQYAFQNYLASVDHFDIVSNNPVIYNFEYQNCGPDSNSPTRMNNGSSQQGSSSSKRSRSPGILRKGSPEIMREQLQQLRNK